MKREFYSVVVSEIFSEFTKEVESLLKEGWELQGGICVFGAVGESQKDKEIPDREATLHFSQAMTFIDYSVAVMDTSHA